MFRMSFEKNCLILDIEQGVTRRSVTLSRRRIVAGHLVAVPSRRRDV